MWWQDLIDLVYPPPLLCPLCQIALIEEGLPGCRSCLDQLNLGWRCLDISGYACYSMGIYEQRLKELLGEVKYHRNYQAGMVLGQVLGLACQEESSLQGVDWLLPVPLHPNRLEKRGFNQALVLAEGIRSVWKRNIFGGAIRRHDTEPLRDQGPIARRRSLSHAFLLNNPTRLQGKRVLIVDDIFTTGATFQTMAGLVQLYQGIPLGVFVAKSPREE